MIGGKLTTYRHLAEDATDRVVRRLHSPKTECMTAKLKLPGAIGELADIAERLSTCPSIGPKSRAHLMAVYGCRALLVKDLVDARPELGEVICPFSHAIAAEIVFSYEHELATTLADVLLRRTMIGLSSDQGRAALPRAIDVARTHFGWTAVRADEEERRYLREIARLQPAK